MAPLSGGAFLDPQRSNVQPEKRLLLSVLLLAVAQQDPRNVKWLTGRNTERDRFLIATEAMKFVGSREFEEMCWWIDLEPDRLRQLQPDRALRGWKILMNDKDQDDS